MTARYPSTVSEGPFAREAIRLYRRYEVEIVGALGLCPWAERARADGRVQERVVESADLDVEAALEAVAELGADEAVEIGLVLFPRLRASAEEFGRFVSELVTADAARRELGAAPFALAAFHPEGHRDLSEPERAIPFLRRTPDPTIQLVRVASLDRVREGHNEGTHFVDVRALMTLDWTREDTLPLRERIARANLRTVERLGPDEVERRFAAIFADRTATYAALSGDDRALPR
jgi:hypothetical protein